MRKIHGDILSHPVSLDVYSLIYMPFCDCHFEAMTNISRSLMLLLLILCLCN